MSDFEKERLDVCNKCPYNSEQICILCGCELENKVKVKGESCPHTPSFWGPVGEPKVYKQPSQMKIAGLEPNPAQQPTECIPCKNRH